MKWWNVALPVSRPKMAPSSPDRGRFRARMSLDLGETRRIRRPRSPQTEGATEEGLRGEVALCGRKSRRQVTWGYPGYGPSAPYIVI